MVRLRNIILLGAWTAVALEPAPARADNFFDGAVAWARSWFGGEPAPAPKAGAAVYALTMDAPDSAPLAPLQASSNLFRLRREPPESGEGLARRAQADLPRVVDALWAEGYFDASATAAVAGAPLTMTSDAGALDAAGRAANAEIGRSVIPVRLTIRPGALYRIGAIRVIDARTGADLAPEYASRRVLRLVPGDPARANAVRDAAARLGDHFRAQSFPLAKVDIASAIVRHDQLTLDVTLSVDAGAKAGFGAVTVSGTKRVDPTVIRSFIYVEPGDPFSPEKLAAMRRSLAQLEILGSTRILEADHLDSDGNLPIDVVVDERKQYAVSAAAQYSTLDGPSARADWTNRNMFGGAERLRLSGVIGYATDNSLNGRTQTNFEPNRMIGRLNANFIKPALGGTTNDYLADVTLAREATTSYQAQYFNVSQYLRHRFDENFWIQGGWEIERGTSKDSFGDTNYFLSGVSVALRYDTTDNALDPHSGWRATVSGGAYPKFFGSSINLFQGKSQVSTYYALDEDNRYVLAGRVAIGAGGGSDILDIPDNRRFFAGGGGSVRGYPYRSLSPLGANGDPMGGQSLFEASVEARIKVTDEIGVVPFFDAGQAYATSFPNFQENLCSAVGLGLRYYTGFGPFRVDVAFPLQRQAGDAALALYFGIGQAF